MPKGFDFDGYDISDAIAAVLAPNPTLTKLQAALVVIHEILHTHGGAIVCAKAVFEEYPYFDEQTRSRKQALTRNVQVISRTAAATHTGGSAITAQQKAKEATHREKSEAENKFRLLLAEFRKVQRHRWETEDRQRRNKPFVPKGVVEDIQGFFEPLPDKTAVVAAQLNAKGGHKGGQDIHSNSSTPDT